MAKTIEKEEAIVLRKKGFSIGEISLKLKVSKSSVSKWVSDVELTKEQFQRIKNKEQLFSLQGRVKGAQSNKNKKILNLHNQYLVSKSQIGKVSNRDLLFLVAGLFWAEGNKTGSRFIFVNSDPDMIKIVLNFIINELNYANFKIHIQLNIDHKERVDEIRRFWINKLKIKKEDFGGFRFNHSKTVKFYNNRTLYKGTCILYFNKSSLLQYRFLGYINTIKEYMSG